MNVSQPCFALACEESAQLFRKFVNKLVLRSCSMVHAKTIYPHVLNNKIQRIGVKKHATFNRDSRFWLWLFVIQKSV